MARILKHEIPAASEFTLPLHEGSKILKLDTVNDTAYLWVQEDETKPVRDVNFQVAMTGMELDLPPFYVYIDSFIVYNGSFLGHLFMDTSVPVKIEGKI